MTLASKMLQVAASFLLAAGVLKTPLRAQSDVQVKDLGGGISISMPDWYEIQQIEGRSAANRLFARSKDMSTMTIIVNAGASPGMTRHEYDNLNASKLASFGERACADNQRQADQSAIRILECQKPRLRTIAGRTAILIELTRAAVPEAIHTWQIWIPSEGQLVAALVSCPVSLVEDFTSVATFILESIRAP
jgi:hypothetical protein